MNIKQLTKIAEKRGYSITVDKTGPQWLFTIISKDFPSNAPIETDRHGLELFLFDVDGYLEYCYNAGIEPF